MSRRNKLQKFAELLTLPNVYENFNPETTGLTAGHGEVVEIKGKWNEIHFPEAQPLTLELACGRGEYSLALAEMYPDRNFIGVDIKGARIWKGARIAHERKLENVAFLRTRIELIARFFQFDEVDQIWITFPDPFPKKENRRLTADRYLHEYRKILKPGGLLHLKTDDTALFEFSLETLESEHAVQIETVIRDIYADHLPLPELEIKTYYELQHLRNGKKIHYLRCRMG